MAARILVVEGDKNVLDLITSGLADDGYELVSVPSAEDALQVAKNDRVDLILLEVELPGMSGFDMVKQLRMDPAMQATPIIFLTGRTGLQDRVEGLRLGAHAYITKPFAFPELQATLDGVLQRAPAPAQAQSSAPPALGVMGSLGAISITSVIQAIEGEVQTGVLSVVSGTRWGKMSFHKGKIMDAASNNAKGEEAIYEFVGWDSGTYAFRAQAVEAKEPLAESATSILMRAVQHQDERQAMI